MDIVVKGRNVEVPEHYRVHVGEKLRKVERYDQKLFRIDVELLHEPNPRQADRCQRVEITCYSKGPVIRAEACAADFYSALDAAIGKLETRLRRAADRRRIHYGRQTPVSVAAATAALLPDPGMPAAKGAERAGSVAQTVPESAIVSQRDEPAYEPGRIVRRKEHLAQPMSVDDALFEMELVGHDFYLFLDKESGRPSVVYRRKGYDYGLISLVE
ncbi:MAG: ribosome-associated translation inhibitor RaiA [Micromonosporaceae bacterium]